MARQRLGQHFLINGSILQRIAAAACPDGTELAIEIGPGRGALTERLLKRAGRVVAIELDLLLVEHLRAKFQGLEVQHADVLQTDLTQWGPGVICGNLPYYIASPILERVVRGPFQRAVFLIQKEVAERLAAKPGVRDYGYLTVATAVFATVRVLFQVKPVAFHPPPKVDSAVVLLEPRQTPAVEDPAAFLEFAGRAFQQKRKTIRNNLAGTYGEAVSEWPEAGKRAEQLSLDELVAMFRRVAKSPAVS